MAVRIAPLQSREDARCIAGWIWREWAHAEPGLDPAHCEALVLSALEDRPLPRFFTAHDGPLLVGCASVVARDLPVRPALGPWLANVYVRPEWRGQGIGRALVQCATAAGLALGPELYLYTASAAAYYEALGWTRVDRADYAGQSVEILRLRAG